MNRFRKPGVRVFSKCLWKAIMAAGAVLATWTASGAATENMQYYRPAGQFFVGDCMPFFQDGVFHLYYLLDENHHQGKKGLGGHQWAHATTTDLRHWTHHPLAVAITDENEASICTGSVFHHDGVFRGYYATRRMDGTEHLSLATSTDGIHFEKTLPNPFASPGEGYAPRAFRDPCVFRDDGTGLFHLLVSASLTGCPVPDRGGCLAQFTSRDLKDWERVEPFLVPGYRGVPECPDYFAWNGWFYLLFSIDGIAHYRMSREALGPWLRPEVDTLDGPMARVMKTAAFTGGRRLGVAFLPTLEGGKDHGGWQYAGNAVFREIVQHPDGSLGSRFPEEMTPEGTEVAGLSFAPLTQQASGDAQRVQLRAPEGFAAGHLAGTPVNARITFRVVPEAGASDFGVCVRGSGDYAEGYEIRFSPPERRVSLRRPQSGTLEFPPGNALLNVDGLDRPFSVDLVMSGDIIDLCVDKRRCLINRCPELRGDRLFFFAQNSSVAFEMIAVHSL